METIEVLKRVEAVIHTLEKGSRFISRVYKKDKEFACAYAMSDIRTELYALREDLEKEL